MSSSSKKQNDHSFDETKSAATVAATETTFASIKSFPNMNEKLFTDKIDLSNDEESFKYNLPFFSKKKTQQKDLMIWSSQPIERPLLKTKNKIIKKEACDLFKLIQEFMGDRAIQSSPSITQHQVDLKPFNRNFSSNSAILSSQQVTPSDFVCLEIVRKGWTYANLRDELFLQIVKQTTLNFNPKSFLLGWELMAVCLSFFPPTQKLYQFLSDYIVFHSSLNTNFYSAPPDSQANLALDQEFESVMMTLKASGDDSSSEFQLNKISNSCKRRLERISVTGAKKGLKSPSIEEALLAKHTILSQSLFGSTLSEIMELQPKTCPSLCLPWIQTTLSEAILRLEGAKTEGIFRVPGDLDEVNNLKVYFDQLWCSGNIFQDNSLNSMLIDKIHDPHLPASLLKLWYRELHEPLIPDEFYSECIEKCDDRDECIGIIERLPQINKLVFTYLIRFLKVFAASENVAITKMDANNLSMIMAPNCLRCKSNEPKVIMENTKKEMQFIKTLIQHLDTSIVQGIL